MLPSWFSASVPTNETDPVSFEDTDIAASLVEQEDVAGISECESVTTDDPGLYIVLRYGRGFEVFVDGNSVRYRPSADRDPLCMAVNLCQQVNSPIYLGLPDEVQSIARQLPIFALYNRYGWSYSIDSVTLYGKPKEVTISDQYWNGTAAYMPTVLRSDLRIKTMATVNFQNTMQDELISVQVNFEGDIATYFKNEQV